MSINYRKWFVRANGIKTHFIEAGSGEPVVLVHGGGPGACGKHNWGNNVPVLAERFHVFAIDLIGYGLTDKPPIEYSYQAKVDHIAGFIDTLCLDQVHLGGNSMGTYLVVRYALDHPDRVKKVLMVATATVAGAMGVGTFSKEGGTPRQSVGERSPPEAMRAWLGTLLYNKDRITDELVERRVRLAALPGAAEAQKSYWEHMAKIRVDPNLKQWYDVSQRLPKVTIPLALVWGKEDQFAPVELAHRLREALPNLKEFHLVDKAGHQVQNDQPEKFNEIALQFFLQPS